MSQKPGQEMRHAEGLSPDLVGPERELPVVPCSQIKENRCAASLSGFRQDTGEKRGLSVTCCRLSPCLCLYRCGESQICGLSCLSCPSFWRRLECGLHPPDFCREAEHHG